ARAAVGDVAAAPADEHVVAGPPGEAVRTALAAKHGPVTPTLGQVDVVVVADPAQPVAAATARRHDVAAVGGEVVVLRVTLHPHRAAGGDGVVEPDGRDLEAVDADRLRRQ